MNKVKGKVLKVDPNILMTFQDQRSKSHDSTYPQTPNPRCRTFRCRTFKRPPDFRLSLLPAATINLDALKKTLGKNRKFNCGSFFSVGANRKSVGCSHGGGGGDLKTWRAIKILKQWKNLTSSSRKMDSQQESASKHAPEQQMP